MNWKRIKYIFLSCVVGFVIWVIGELILMFKFPESTLLAARIWAIAVFVGTCIWSIVHFHRAEKKKREDEENENYKGVY